MKCHLSTIAILVNPGDAEICDPVVLNYNRETGPKGYQNRNSVYVLPLPLGTVRLPKKFGMSVFIMYLS